MPYRFMVKRPFVAGYQLLQHFLLPDRIEFRDALLFFFDAQLLGDFGPLRQKRKQLQIHLIQFRAQLFQTSLTHRNVSPLSLGFDF